TIRDALARERALADQNAAVDYLLHPILRDPSAESLAQIPELAREGHTSLKIFLVSDQFDARVDDYLRAMQLAAQSGTLTLLHCEDGALIRCLCRALLEPGRRARAEGVQVFVETRPLYLYLTRELFAQPDGAKYVGAPPLREPGDVRAIWQGLQSGEIQTLCTDHAPWTLRQKLDPSLDV